MPALTKSGKIGSSPTIARMAALEDVEGDAGFVPEAEPLAAEPLAEVAVDAAEDN